MNKHTSSIAFLFFSLSLSFVYSHVECLYHLDWDLWGKDHDSSLCKLPCKIMILYMFVCFLIVACLLVSAFLNLILLHKQLQGTTCIHYYGNSEYCVCLTLILLHIFMVWEITPFFRKFGWHGTCLINDQKKQTDQPRFIFGAVFLWMLFNPFWKPGSKH